MPLYPEQASNFAPQVDNLVLFMIAVCLVFAVAICAAVIYFFFKYKRQRPDEIGVPIHGDLRLEIAWIVLPFFLLLAMFGWGAAIYVDYRHTPADTLDIYVIGKQWMWKLQHMEGQRAGNADAQYGDAVGPGPADGLAEQTGDDGRCQRRQRDGEINPLHALLVPQP